MHRAEGVPLSGAMDTLASRLANLVLGNACTDAVIEFTYGNASFLAETDLLLAYVGEGAILQTEKGTLPAGKPIFIPAGTHIEILDSQIGARTYLAIAGGWDVPIALGSRSTYLHAHLGGLHGGLLRRGDHLQHTVHLSDLTKRLWNQLSGKYIRFTHWYVGKDRFQVSKKIIRIVPGREFTWFTATSLLSFLSSPYHVGIRSNRMGYQLQGQTVERMEKTELLSTAVVPGTIQVSNDGSLILLMADSQTTGGYPRIAQVAAVDLAICAQLKPGDSFSFSAISRHEAEKLYLEQEKQLQKLATAIHLIA